MPKPGLREIMGLREGAVASKPCVEDQWPVSTSYDEEEEEEAKEEDYTTIGFLPAHAPCLASRRMQQSTVGPKLFRAS